MAVVLTCEDTEIGVPYGGKVLIHGPFVALETVPDGKVYVRSQHLNLYVRETVDEIANLMDARRNA